MNDKFILNGHIPVPCSNIKEWAMWFEKANRTVEKTIVAPGIDSVSWIGSWIWISASYSI